MSNIINPYRFAAEGSSSDSDYIILEAYIDSSWTEVGEECSGRSTHKFYEITATTTVRVSGNNNVEPLYYICLGGGGGGAGCRHASGGGAGGFPGESSKGSGTWSGFDDGSHTAYGDSFTPTNATVYTCTVGGGGLAGRSTDSAASPSSTYTEYQGSSGSPTPRSSSGANSGMGPYPRGLGLSGTNGTDSTIKEGGYFVLGDSGYDAEGKGGGGGGMWTSTTGSATGEDGKNGGCGGGARLAVYTEGTGSQGGNGGGTDTPYASSGGGMGGDGLSGGGGGAGITHYLKGTGGEALAGGGANGTVSSAHSGGSGGGEDGGFFVWPAYGSPPTGGEPTGIPWDSGHPNTGGGGGGAGYPEWGYGEYGGYGSSWLYPRDGTGYSPDQPWDRTHATDGNSGVIILMWQVS